MIKQQESDRSFHTPDERHISMCGHSSGGCSCAHITPGEPEDSVLQSIAGSRAPGTLLDSNRPCWVFTRWVQGHTASKWRNQDRSNSQASLCGTDSASHGVRTEGCVGGFVAGGARVKQERRRWRRKRDPLREVQVGVDASGRVRRPEGGGSGWDEGNLGVPAKSF